MNNRSEANVVSDSKISWHCIEPVILEIRGKSVEIKNEAFKKLNEGQKSIFSFHVYYEHAKNDLDSFVYWSRLYLGSGFFAEIKNGANYFGDSDYRGVLDEVEKAFQNGNRREIAKVYDRFRVIGERHKTKMGKVIKANQEYFSIRPSGGRKSA